MPLAPDLFCYSGNKMVLLQDFGDKWLAFGSCYRGLVTPRNAGWG